MASSKCVLLVKSKDGACQLAGSRRIVPLAGARVRAMRLAQGVCISSTIKGRRAFGPYVDKCIRLTGAHGDAIVRLSEISLLLGAPVCAGGGWPHDNSSRSTPFPSKKPNRLTGAATYRARASGATIGGVIINCRRCCSINVDAPARPSRTIGESLPAVLARGSSASDASGRSHHER
eukprot:scaffold279287_cov31-Tisochrysis_lutea.AAC.2